MKPVARDELLDLTAYEKARPQIRKRIIELKAPRRVHVGEFLTFLFENPETVRYQVQEMLRAERIVDEAAIAHELETYYELLGKRGELGCALLIEIDDPVLRDVKLREWLLLPKHLKTHLAVALGTPTVGLYVATRPGLTGLHGAHDAVNLGGPGKAPSVDEVVRVLLGPAARA